MFKNWTLGRLLSKRYYLKLLAEASPESFLSFLEDESNFEIIKKVFEPQSGFFNSWNVYYTEILFALECLAWDENYFSRVVKLLLFYSEIENNSNEHNRPINSLKNIFHLQLPQTYVSFEIRINVLKRIAKKFNDLHTLIFDICVSMLLSIGPNSMFPSSHFRWRTYDNSRGRDVLQNGCGDDLKTIIELLLQCCDFSKDEVCKLIDLSIDSNIFPFNNLIINFLKDYSVDKVVDIEIVDKLRNNIVRHLNHPTAKWSMKAKQLQSHQELLSLIEPKDLILKYLWLFDYKVEIPYNKRDEITELLLEKRKNVIREVIESDNELRIWEMVKRAKNSSAIAEPLVVLYGDSQKDIVCQLFKNDSINDKFVSEYLNKIYCLDPKSYTTWAESVVRADNAMSFVLYLIWYYKEISDIANNIGNSVYYEYWANVKIYGVEYDCVEFVVNQLIGVNRYSDAIEIIERYYDNNQISDKKIILIIRDILSDNSKLTQFRQVNHISVSNTSSALIPVDYFDRDISSLISLLERIDKIRNPEIKNELVQIEFLLYSYIDSDGWINESLFVYELTHNPKLMIQLIELAYKSDDESDNDSNNDAFVKLAQRILFHGCKLAPEIASPEDEIDFVKFIEDLLKLGKERKRTKVIYHIVGEILGDLPRNENYPPEFLCEIIEDLCNENVECGFRHRVFNNRGAYFVGDGTPDNNLAFSFERYKNRISPEYGRIRKVFESLSESYKDDAKYFKMSHQMQDLER